MLTPSLAALGGIVLSLLLLAAVVGGVFWVIRAAARRGAREALEDHEAAKAGPGQ